MAFSKEQAQAAAKKSQSQEAKKKRRATVKAAAERRSAEEAVLTSVYGHLVEGDFLDKFVVKFLDEAKKKPNSRAAAKLADIVFANDLMGKLDAERDKVIARDVAFARYRLAQTLFTKQKEVFDDLISRRIVNICGRRAGKTELNARLLVRACLAPNTPCAYIHLTRTNAIEQLFDIVLKVASAISLPIRNGKEKRGDRNEGVIEFENGSSIKFFGNGSKDEREKIRGFKYRLVIIDEGQSQKNLRYLVGEVLEPLLMDFADSQLIMTGTPPRIPHTFFEECYKSREYTHYHWDMRDNPFIPNVEEELANICKRKGLTMESALIQREYLGVITYDTEALVFKGYRTYSALPDDFKPTNVYIGLDFGFSDYNAVVVLAVDTARRVGYELSDLEKKFNQSTVTEIIGAVRSAADGAKDFLIKRNPNADLNNIGIFADTNEKSIVYELSITYQLPAFCAYKHDKMFAMAQLAEWFRNGTLYAYDGGILADEFERVVFRRDPDTDALLNEIDDDVYHPDATDAALYASRQFAFDIGAETGGEGKPVTGIE